MPSNQHIICFTCRTSLKGMGGTGFPCTICGTPLVNMGRDFKPPKKNNLKQWRKVFLIYQKGYGFGRWRGWKHLTPRTLSEAKRLPSLAPKFILTNYSKYGRVH